ncbi:MAG TPA: cysteine desulfurase [Candidatus Nanoarchaeia archaeon]|nr:cysteine desulfurase [Candidatus Nanoarchaeia archaeon]
MNPEKIRKDFPVLEKGIIYLDSACMSLRPLPVINKIKEYYEQYPACGERSQHSLGKKVTEEVEKSRKEIAEFISAKEKEIIFTKNTTESVNLVAHSLGFRPGEEIIISGKEHNSNLLPWLKQKEERGAILQVIPFNQEFDLEEFQKKLNRKTRLVSVAHISNLDGTSIPINEVIKLAHENGSLVLLDGAQAVPHQKTDVKKIGADFLAFSGHKMLGPSSGVLYGREELLKQMKSFIVGGGTVKDSHYHFAEWDESPAKFEAGLQDYAGMMGLAEATRYLKKIGFNEIHEHEILLNKMVTERLSGKVNLVGPLAAEKREGIFSFNIKELDSHLIAGVLDKSKKIAVRSGTHCVHSWFNQHHLKGSVRASFYLYNTMEEAKIFCEEVEKIAQHF